MTPRLLRRNGRLLVPALAALILSAAALAATAPAGTATSAIDTGTFSHAGLDTVLRAHLREGRVDYGGLARDPGPLHRYLAALRDARPDGWPREDQIAFWVNAYNAHVLNGVVRRPGLKSVRDVGRKLGIPTGAFFRERFVVAGRTLSLNDIEHGIVREKFREPRVHFVLNCASASCPVLPSHPLSGADLDAQLEAATKAFLLDRSRNRIDPTRELALSAIFHWYADDFKAHGGSVRAFIERHWPRDERFAGGIRVRFLDYDWSLNGAW